MGSLQEFCCGGNMKLKLLHQTQECLYTNKGSQLYRERNGSICSVVRPDHFKRLIRSDDQVILFYGSQTFLTENCSIWLFFLLKSFWTSLNTFCAPFTSPVAPWHTVIKNKRSVSMICGQQTRKCRQMKTWRWKNMAWSQEISLIDLIGYKL